MDPWILDLLARVDWESLVIGFCVGFVAVSVYYLFKRD